MSDVPAVQNLNLNGDEIARRKQLVRDLWAGKPLDHVPVYLSVENPHPQYTIRQQFLDADKQWAESLAVLKLTCEHVPENDLVPAVRPDVGCSCLATAFGAELFWGDDPNQTCGVKHRIVERVEDAYGLAVPRPDAGQLAEGIRRVRQFAEAGEGLISVSLLDMAGGLNVAMDLLGGNTLYTSMYENPEALECLLGKIQQLFLAAIDLQIEAAGGQDHITTTDFPEYWFPEGRKGHVSDDISANISPASYARFSRPYHNMVFERYGGGGLHNCGPNPCLAEYLGHNPPLRAIDLSYMYSKDDLPRMKQLLKRRALVYMGNFPVDPVEAIEAYRQIMELMTPEVIVVPHLSVPPHKNPREVWRQMRLIADEYAKRLDWGWEEPA
jgi:hypothetical protein